MFPTKYMCWDNFCQSNIRKWHHWVIIRERQVVGIFSSYVMQNYKEDLEESSQKLLVTNFKMFGM